MTNELVLLAYYTCSQFVNKVTQSEHATVVDLAHCEQNLNSPIPANDIGQDDFSFIYSHSLEGVTGLARLLPFDRPGYRNGNFEGSFYTPFTRSSKRPANFQQTFSKCIQNTRANCSTLAGNLLDVCWIV